MKKYRVTSYFFGHKHAASWTVEEGVAFVQSGNAVRFDAPCNGKPHWTTTELGYARAEVTEDAFQIQFISVNNEVLFTSPVIGPREKE